jgi:hypothetical protein
MRGFAFSGAKTTVTATRPPSPFSGSTCFKSVVKPWSFTVMRTSGEPRLNDREDSSTIPGILES